MGPTVNFVYLYWEYVLPGFYVCSHPCFDFLKKFAMINFACGWCTLDNIYFFKSETVLKKCLSVYRFYFYR